MAKQGRGRGRELLLGPFGLISLAVVILGICIFLLPQLLVPVQTRSLGGTGAVERLRLQNERIALQNQVRTTLLQAFGGSFVLVTAFFTWRQIQVNREGQITERFTRAIEHLGTEGKLDVRLGGIYALERIANDSRSEHGSIIEILAAFVRGHASPIEPHRDLSELPPLRARATDVQAAMSVLGRRTVMGHDYWALQFGGLDLRKADLAGADLRMADFSAAHLSGANLQGADLRAAGFEKARLVRANLRHANLSDARLQEVDLQEAELVAADLYEADLRQANLRAADLRGSRLVRANLCRANLGEGKLQGVQLEGATLEEANLWEAKLGGANLRGANLTATRLVQADLDRADLSGATLAGAIMIGASLRGTMLAGVRADRSTVWPSQFDWRSAAVIIEEPERPAG
jgi:uncharacterized protein YjbI with pentapeptide repeats